MRLRQIFDCFRKCIYTYKDSLNYIDQKKLYPILVSCDKCTVMRRLIRMTGSALNQGRRSTKYSTEGEGTEKWWVIHFTIVTGGKLTRNLMWWLVSGMTAEKNHMELDHVNFACSFQSATLNCFVPRSPSEL